MVGVFMALVGLLTWLSVRPQIFNYPVHITEQNAQLVYRAGERTMVWLNVALVVIFLGMTLASFNTANSFVVAGIIACPVILVASLALISIASTKNPESTVPREPTPQR